MRHLIKQITFLTASNVLNRLLAMIFFIILARNLAVSEYGIFRYLTSISMLLAVFFSGFPVSLTRLISRYNNEPIKLSGFFSAGIMASSLILIVEFLVIVVFFEYKFVLVIIVFGLFMDATYFGIIRGFLDYIKLYWFRITANLLKIILIILIISLLEVNIVNASLVFSFVFLITILLLELYSRSRISFSFHQVTKSTFKTVLKFAVPVTLGSLGHSIMFQLDLVIIKHFVDNVNVAHYSVARTVAQVFTFAPMAIATLILPKISGLKRKIDLRPYLKKIMLGVFSSSFLIFIVLLFFGKQIIILLFKEQYLPALSVLYILALGQILISTFGIFSSAWIGIGKPYVGMWIILTVAVINIVLDLVLIPTLGIIGASYASFVASLTAFLSVSISFFVYLKSKHA